jgi:hypothetical protein
MFDMTRIEYAAELIPTAAIPGVISRSTAQLTSDTSAITPLRSGTPYCQLGRRSLAVEGRDGSLEDCCG